MRKLISYILILGVFVTSAYILFQVRVVSREEQAQKIEDFERQATENFETTESEESSNTINVSKEKLIMKGALYIPKIDLKISVYEGSSETALSEGVGIFGTFTADKENKAQLTSKNNVVVPERGENIIITSHNGSSENVLFMNLGKLNIKDEFFIRDDKGVIHTYEVFDTKVVSPIDEEQHILINKEEGYLTLRTCTPTGINSHRLLVTAKLVPTIVEEIPELQTSFSQFEWQMTGVMTVSAVLFFFFLMKDIKEKKKK